MANPLVSVVLATYNWPSVLRYAIRTVLWQTFTDYELLVIGDGCTDDTEAVVHSFGDPRIRWHNLPDNSGNQAGPNHAGLHMARGRYVAYMHQDDLWLPHHLAVLVPALESGDAPLAHTLCLQISLTALDSPERIRVVMGLPNTGYLGPEKRALYTPAIMHRAAEGRRCGGWRDWRALRQTPFVDFIERLGGPEWRCVTVREVTVVKFNSAERRDSYVEQPCHEQAEYFERIRREPDFLPRELLMALEAMMRGRQAIRVLPPRPAHDAPGWEIAVYREMRGLTNHPQPTAAPPRALRRIARRVAASIPPRLRDPVDRWLIHVRSVVGR